MPGGRHHRHALPTPSNHPLMRAIFGAVEQQEGEEEAAACSAKSASQTLATVDVEHAWTGGW